MDCKQAQEWIALAVDDEQARSEELAAHLEACPACQALFQELTEQIAWCTDLSTITPPLAFQARMAEALRGETKRLSKRERWTWVGGIAAAAAALLLAVGLPLSTLKEAEPQAGGLLKQSGKLTLYAAGAEDAGAPDALGESAMRKDAHLQRSLPSIQTANVEADAKRVISGSYTLYTKSFDADIERCMEALSALQGVTQSQTIDQSRGETQRQSKLTLRIPQQSYDAFIERIANLGETDQHVEYSSSMQSMADAYADAQAALSAYEGEMTRLEGYMQQAVEMDAILSLGARISTLQSQIDEQKGRIRYMDAQIANATVSVTVYENVAPKIQPLDDSWGERIRVAWVKSIEGIKNFGSGLVVFLVSAVPVLAVLIVPVGVTVLCIGLVRRRRRKRAALRGDTRT